MTNKKCTIKEQKTILVVEDEKPLLFAIVAKLNKCGFNTLEARSVEEASKYIEGNICVDAVWLDHYLLGSEDGIDLMSRLQNSKLNSTPVFVVSNTVNPNKIRTYLMMGAIKYYTKAEHRLDEIISDIKNTLST
ncbi:response regulator [bacterium]|nr:response regulator [bacterium]